MATKTYAGITVDVNEEGYFTNSSQWTKEIGAEIAKEELVRKLKTFLKCDFEVVNQKAGMRPTVKDRRPLVGTHHTYRNIHILNGLGTRGVMIGPYAAQALFDNLEKRNELNSEINISRFTY